MHDKCHAMCWTVNAAEKLCDYCRRVLGAPYGMTFEQYSELASIGKSKSVKLKPASPRGHKGTMRAAFMNQTWKYMRVRDRVGINSATPQALLDVCRAHI